MTNADRIRQMSDNELLDTLYRLQENALACPVCQRNKGRDRLRIWLSLPVPEGKNEDSDHKNSDL